MGVVGVHEVSVCVRGGRRNYGSQPTCIMDVWTNSQQTRVLKYSCGRKFEQIWRKYTWKKKKNEDEFREVMAKNAEQFS